jgi:pantetheine-phosphate adenylyltransferase
MATMNRHLADVETVFLPTGSEFAHVSSTLLKEVAFLGGDVQPFVPEAVFRRLVPSGGTPGTAGSAGDRPGGA